MISFLVPGGGPYLLTHSVGCLPRAARAALEARFLQPWAEQGGDAWPRWLGAIEEFRTALSQLLGGNAREYSPQANLSSGLAKLLSALPRTAAAKRVLLAAEDSFPSLGFVLRQSQRHGFEVRLIPRDRRPDDLDTWSAALTGDVRLALVTHVHSNTGRVAPAADIARLCAARGILCVLDVAQSAGILPLDLPATGADVVLGSCIKWLCGGPGAGWMWVRAERLAALEPVDVGWFSHADPFEMDIHSFRYADDARRFWGGTPSVAPFVVAAASLAHIAGLGVEAIRAHNQRLVQAFRDGLPPTWRSRLPAWPVGGTLCVPLGSEFDAVTAALKSIDARFDSRGDVIRVSFHACNTTEDAVRVARAWRGDH